MNLILLSEKFYTEYANCPEILTKKSRPYVCLAVRINDVQYAIPFRHHISHKFAFITYNDCGLDYTKAVVIKDATYLALGTPEIERKEWDLIRRNENKIIFGFKSYLNQFKRALRRKDNPNSARFLSYSALQYFQEYFVSGI